MRHWTRENLHSFSLSLSSKLLVVFVWRFKNIDWSIDIHSVTPTQSMVTRTRAPLQSVRSSGPCLQLGLACWQNDRCWGVCASQCTCATYPFRASVSVVLSIMQLLTQSHSRGCAFAAIKYASVSQCCLCPLPVPTRPHCPTQNHPGRNQDQCCV